ncbi:mannosyltransferase [Kitasatospora sp. MAA4]|uniref:glycosyltransferase family 39 protein n=1 Tax=Kitasatospora sp. MAA4 TaxID=3035093 RepID=UPI0024737454|nr:glycosyltransferase family 39 protein [Kitasatospora sp. MAA4]MDH6135916.1 mannosyltransferase [Kitasatospora sp. MAA4]
MSVSARSSAVPTEAPGAHSAGPARGSVGALLAVVARLVWLWPALLTLGLAVYGGGRPLLWPDELATWEAVNRSPAQIWGMLHHVDAVVGLYYFLLHYWTSAFGHSLTMFRLPSALAMAGAAAFVALIGRKVFGNRAAITAGVLFALTPSVSRYGQEARGYAFVVLAAAAATFLLLRALERPGVLRWVFYSVAVVLTGLFHMIALVFLGSHALIVAWRWWTRRERRLLIGFPLAVLVALAALAPLVITGQRQVDRQLNWIPKPKITDVGNSLWPGMFGSTGVALCILAMAVLPLAWAKGRRGAAELGLVAVLPIPAIGIISMGSTSYFLDRYLLFTVPIWAVLAGAGLAALRPRVLLPVGLAAVVLLGYHEQKAEREPYAFVNWDGKAAAAVIAQGYRPGDGIAPARGGAILQGVPTAMDFYLPQNDKLKDVFVAKSAPEVDDLYPLMCTDPAACLGDTPRVWVVAQGTPGQQFGTFSPAELAALKAAYPKQTVTAVPGATVTLMER